MDPRLLFVNLNSRARPPRTHVTSTLQTTSLPQPTRTPTTPALSNRVLYGEGIHYRLRRFRLAGARRTVSLTGLRPAPRTRVRSARTPSTSSRTLFTGTSWVRARPNRVLNGSNPFSRAPSLALLRRARSEQGSVLRDSWSTAGRPERRRRSTLDSRVGPLPRTRLSN